MENATADAVKMEAKMTGLEKILKAINDEAQLVADKILEEANRQAQEILAAAKSEAEKKEAQITEKAELEVRDIMNRSESAAALQERKILLETKQQLISSTIAKARSSLAELPALEYIEIILSMVKKYAHDSAGQIQFSAADIRRLPADFNELLKNALSNRPLAELTVSEKTANLDGGFLLIYGDIEENCSFDALFSAEKDTLQDKVYSLLFAD
jgi:V/A-type H+-transporting ATPase subunit E